MESGNASVILSTLIFSPVPDDHGKMLKCRGENPALKNAFLDDTFKLNVVCKCFLFLSQNEIDIIMRNKFSSDWWVHDELNELLFRRQYPANEIYLFTYNNLIVLILLVYTI